MFFTQNRVDLSKVVPWHSYDAQSLKKFDSEEQNVSSMMDFHRFYELNVLDLADFRNKMVVERQYEHLV